MYFPFLYYLIPGMWFLLNIHRDFCWPWHERKHPHYTMNEMLINICHAGLISMKSRNANNISNFIFNVWEIIIHLHAPLSAIYILIVMDHLTRNIYMPYLEIQMTCKPTQRISITNKQNEIVIWHNRLTKILLKCKLMRCDFAILTFIYIWLFLEKFTYIMTNPGFLLSTDVYQIWFFRYTKIV